MMGKLARALAWALTVALGAACAVGLALGLSVTSLWALAALLGLVSAPLRARPKPQAWAAVGALAALVALRVGCADVGGLSMKTAGSPGVGGSGWMGRTLDEQDAAVLGAWALWGSGRLPRERLLGLPWAMRGAYTEMFVREGFTPTPLPATFLGPVSARGYDQIEVAPLGASPSGLAPGAVVFLHGYAGNFTINCWEVAQATRGLGLWSVCPSMSFDGRWQRRDGEAIVRATLAELRGRGVQDVWLAGLSNGAIGASRLASPLRRELRGVILLSGASAGAGDAGLPTLLLTGAWDTMTSPATSRALAKRLGERATYVELPDEGHFVFLQARDEVRDHIHGWLKAQRTPMTAPRPAPRGATPRRHL